MTISKQLGISSPDRGEWLLFNSRNARRLKVRAVRRLRTTEEANYFSTWFDADENYPFGLHIGHADWVPPGQVTFQ